MSHCQRPFLACWSQAPVECSSSIRGHRGGWDSSILTLFDNHPEGKGVLITPCFMKRMWNEKREPPWANLRFQPKLNQTSPLTRYARKCWPFKCLKEVESSKGEESNNLHKIDLVDEATPWFETIGVSLEHRVAYFRCFLEEFASTLEDVAQLNFLLLVREANARGTIF